MREPTFEKIYNRDFIKSQAVDVFPLDDDDSFRPLNLEFGPDYKVYMDFMKWHKEFVSEISGIPKS